MDKRVTLHDLAMMKQDEIKDEIDEYDEHAYGNLRPYVQDRVDSYEELQEFIHDRHANDWIERLMTYDSEHYYAVQTFLEDDELHKIWNIIEIAMNREGYDIENAELSMRLYDSELEENIEHDMENLLGSLSEGEDYGSKVDALVDSMGVTDKKVSSIHRRKDMDLL